MTSSKFTFSIYLLTFALSLQTIFGASPLFQFCLSSAGNFTTNDPYGSNLKTLLGNLHYQTPPLGFGLSSVGSNSYQNYGLALCRSGVNATAC
uniref:Gnk2-homologous domain-containing protein n=1 Tax=Quercus lobata TaxID=97700 RepID=A0A7N2MW38_QUELO